MLCLTTRRLLYHCDHLSFLPRSLCLSLPLSFSIPPASTLSHIALTIVLLSIYISLSLVPLSFLSPSFFRPLPLPPSPPLDHPFSLALVHLSFLFSIFLSLISSVFIFLLLVYAAHRTIAISLAPPSNRRRAPADFAFKFGKFAGVGK